MSYDSQAKILERYFPDIVRFHVLDNVNIYGVKEWLDRQEPDVRISTSMITKRLRERGVYKNNCFIDAGFVLANLKAMGCELHKCLVLSGGILLDIERIQAYHDSPKTREGNSRFDIRAKHILFVPLQFSFGELTDWGFFKEFQRLLWYTKVYFDRCFDTGIWVPDERGVYGRSEELVAGLTDLSRLHNLMSAAMECFRHGEDRNGMIKVRTALDLSRPVVQTHHDRQFPDLLAILLRLELDGRSDIRVNMTEHLRDLANVILEHNDPRRTMFNELINLRIDTAGHLYIAFDTCCRHIWRTRIAENDSIKAYYGYNQASFPRILPGKFYELYEGKTDMEIASILTEVDQQFVVFDHARVCLWQTAIRFLLREQRFAPAEDICNSLLLSLIQCGGPRELYQQRQFNVDVAISHSLCGAVYEAQSRRINAISSFANCVGKRNEVLPQDFWDPIRAGALEKMKHLATELGITGMADDCKRQLRVMDAAMAEEDKRR